MQTPFTTDFLMVRGDPLREVARFFKVTCWSLQDKVCARLAWPSRNRAQRMASRPAIPAELRRKVLVEAGHRCAIPQCRHIDVEIHHITPWEKCEEHKYENLIALCPNCHTRADKGDIDRKSLKRYKANLQFIHDKFSQIEIDILFKLYEISPNRMSCPSFMHILIGRIIDAEYIEYHEQHGTVDIDGIKASPDYLSITGKGIEFIENISSVEI